MKSPIQVVAEKLKSSRNNDHEINISSRNGVLGDSSCIEQMTLVFFIKRGETISKLNMYSFFLQSSTNKDKSISELRIKYPKNCKNIIDRTHEFFKEEAINAVYLKSKNYVVVDSVEEMQKSTLELDFPKMSKEVEAELNEWYEKTSSSPINHKPLIAFTKSFNGEKNKIIISGKSEQVAGESNATLTHTLGKHLFPKSLHPIHPHVSYWTKAEWSYEEPYTEEINFDLQLTFENNVSIKALSIYLVCEDGFEIQNTTNHFVRETDDNEEENREFSFVQRYDHRTKEREFFKEWENLSIRTSNMFKCYIGNGAKQLLDQGIKRIEVSIRLNDVQSRIRKELFLVVFTVILGLVAEFIKDINPIQFYRMDGIPMAFTNSLLFAMVFVSSLQIIRKSNLGIKWLNNANRTIFIFLGLTAIYYIIGKEIQTFNPPNWINDIIFIMMGIYISTVTIVIVFRKLLRDRITRYFLRAV